MIGSKFNRLTVLKDLGKVPGSRKYLCVCDCGKETKVKRCHLMAGHTKSCGCLSKETRGIHLYKHGFLQHGVKPLVYSTWSSMLDRCYNKNNSHYAYYGGRGIFVCDAWHDFEKFYSDMGDKKVGFSLDRIDSDKGYSPENCRWATRRVQSTNRTKRKDCSSIYIGVYKHGKKWVSRCDGKDYGRFDNEIQAAAMYNKKAAEIFGDFANINKQIEVIEHVLNEPRDS